MIEYFERGGISGGQDYLNNLVAPHATTVRWTYTIPTGKHAYVAYATCKLMRDVAPTGLAMAESYINFTPSAGGLSRIYTTLQSATVGDQERADIGGIGVYGPGDKIEGKTYDGGTGGSHTYHVSIGYTEFT